MGAPRRDSCDWGIHRKRPGETRVSKAQLLQASWLPGNPPNIDSGVVDADTGLELTLQD